MMRFSASILAAAMLAAPSTLLAGAGAGGFALVNGAGADIQSMTIRRVGAKEWRPLAAATPAGRPVPAAFTDPDCAFDIQATLADGTTVTWTGVNLCDVKLLTLRRNAAGLAWVDYD